MWSRAELLSTAVPAARPPGQSTAVRPSGCRGPRTRTSSFVSAPGDRPARPRLPAQPRHQRRHPRSNAPTRSGERRDRAGICQPSGGGTSPARWWAPDRLHARRGRLLAFGRAGGPANSSVDGVDGGLLRALTADDRVQAGLDVVGGAVGAGVGVRRGVVVLLELADAAGGVLGGADVGPVVGDLALEPAGQGLALGLLEGGGAEVDAGAGLVAGDGRELRVLGPGHRGGVVL